MPPPRRRPPLVTRLAVGLALGLAGLAPDATVSRADEPLTPERALVALRALTQVDGDSVGYDGTEGRFFALSRRMLAVGDEASRRALLAEPDAVARAMGLYLLVATKGKDAVPDLTARLLDRARFDHYPAGCVGGAMSVGGFARELLRNRHHLRYGVPAEPLVDAAALRRIDLGLLAEHRAANLHEAARAAMGRELEAGALRLDLEALRVAGGGLSDVALVKAAGRLAGEASRRFLLTSLASETLDPVARLAAASALTRAASNEATVAIERARAVLDRAAGSPVTDRLLATVEARVDFDRRWAAVLAAASAPEPTSPESRQSRSQALERLLVEAVSVDRAFAVRTLGGAIEWKVGRSAHRGRALESLLRIASRLEPAAEWDTDGDAPYVLEILALPVRGYEADRPDSAEPLRAAERARLLQALRPHLSAK